MRPFAVSDAASLSSELFAITFPTHPREEAACDVAISSPFSAAVTPISLRDVTTRFVIILRFFLQQPLQPLRGTPLLALLRSQTLFCRILVSRTASVGMEELEPVEYSPSHSDYWHEKTKISERADAPRMRDLLPSLKGHPPDARGWGVCQIRRSPSGWARSPYPQVIPTDSSRIHRTQVYKDFPTASPARRGLAATSS